MNHQKGFASALALIIALAALGVGGYAYQAKKHAVRKIDEEKEYETTARTSPVMQVTSQPTQLPEELVKLNAAKDFLATLASKTRSAETLIVPKVKQVSLLVKGKRVVKQLSGFTISPGLEGNAGALLASKGFTQDMYNSGDGTFHSASAYVSKTLICINDAERVNPKGDVTLCDESANSPCYTKTELFCAILDQ